jgi:hypothetical protein
MAAGETMIVIATIMITTTMTTDRYCTQASNWPLITCCASLASA